MGRAVSRPRSWCLMLGIVLTAVLLTSVSAAGSYLDRAQFLVAQSDQASGFLRAHLRDRQLAELIRREAEGRLKSAKATIVPKKVVMAHPHLLLMLESFERAASAVAAGDLKLYYRTHKRVQEEAELFESILLQLGWRLPAQESRRARP